MDYKTELKKREDNIDKLIETIRGIEISISTINLTNTEYNEYIWYKIKKSDKLINNIISECLPITWEFTKGMLFGKGIINMINTIGIAATMKCISLIDYSIEAYSICDNIIGTDNVYLLRSISSNLNSNDRYQSYHLNENNPLILFDIIINLVFSSTGEYYGNVSKLITIINEIKKIPKQECKDYSKGIYRLPIPLKTIKIGILSLEKINLTEVLSNVKS